MSRAAQDRRIVDYLLGTLPEGEQERVEQEFLSDDGRYEEVLAAEDELLLDYARGELAPDDRLRVEQRLIQSEQDRERLAWARALAAWFDSPRTDSRRAWSTLRLRSSFGGQAIKYLLPIAALVAVAFGALVAQNLTLRRQVEQSDAARATAEQALAQAQGNAAERDRLAKRLAELQEEQARLAQNTAPPPGSRPTPLVVSLSLAPGLVRGSGAMPRVVLAGGATGLRLQLELPADITARPFTALLRDADGRTRWTAAAPAAGRSVSVEIPASRLGRGDYEVVLRDRTPAGSAGDIAEYYFSVTR